MGSYRAGAGGVTLKGSAWLGGKIDFAAGR